LPGSQSGSPSGRSPTFPIEQARGIAEQKNSDIALGKNPAADRRAVRDEMTLEQLFETFLEHHAKLHKKTWQDDIGTFNLHLGAWKLKRISEVRKMDVQQLHARIGKASGHYAANRVVELHDGTYRAHLRRSNQESQLASLV
jgi:hypothetical protein